jgi:hypothetical protein
VRLQDIRRTTIGLAARPNVWDVAALILVIGAMVLIVYGGQQTVAPLSELERAPVSLDPANLPLYALRTTLRMLLAIVCSTVFTFIYAAIAAKSRQAELVMIPLLDILQSGPNFQFASGKCQPVHESRRATRLREAGLDRTRLSIGSNQQHSALNPWSSLGLRVLATWADEPARALLRLPRIGGCSAMIGRARGFDSATKSAEESACI